MNHQNINTYIDKYYEGSLSIEEETHFIDYLKNSDNTNHDIVLAQIDGLNKFFNDEKMLDDSFDSRVLQSISTGSETISSRFPTKTTFKGFSFNRVLSGIAATGLILISIWVTSNILGSKEVYGTVNDPQIAFAETKKALQKVSSNVKKAVSPAAKSMKKVETGLENTKNLEKATKAIKDIDRINKLNDTGQLLKSLTKVTVKAGKS